LSTPTDLDRLIIELAKLSGATTEEMRAQLASMPPADLAKLIDGLPDKIKASLANLSEIRPNIGPGKWLPTPGPQADAYHCPAQLLLYGGAGGSGKSDLGLGLAFTAHRRSLILRRHYANLSGLTDRAIEINGGRQGYNGSPPPRLQTADGRSLQFAGCALLGDEQAWQGIPFDLKIFDEAVQFLEPMVRFHLGWLRTTDPGQRTRAVLATNPPVDASGDWIIGMFRPWLDLTYHKPARPGEIRWFVTDPDGRDLEVDGPEPVEMGGKRLDPTSRTFIPGRLADNPYLVRTDYGAQLDALPEPIRSAVRDGNFMAARKDADFQVIPTRWVIEAQARWTPDGYKQHIMTALAFDPAGGGRDDAVIAYRHSGWYGKCISEQGKQTADGSAAAAKIIQHRRDNCPVIVDAGGGAGHGFGGTTIMRLRDNGVDVLPYNGASTSTAKARGELGFANLRAESWWRFRESLDPDQEGGSVVALPPDPELLADLTAPTYAPTARGILVEEKAEIRKRIGRSPGRGDAVVMCLSHGDKAVRRQMAGAAGRQIMVHSTYGTYRPGSRPPKLRGA
jgi:hypothetical protein